MSLLKSKLSQKIPVWQEDLKSLLGEHGDKAISEVTLQQMYGGSRVLRHLIGRS